MFDLTSSKLLILAIVALIVVGPKDLPILLRTVGKYLGVIRRHANDFRAQLEEALRESELDQVKKDIEGIEREMRSTIAESTSTLDREVETARLGIEGALDGKSAKAGSKDDAQGEPAKPPVQPEKTGT
jgi:sec-independent protein translocase protein TatB